MKRNMLDVKPPVSQKQKRKMQNISCVIQNHQLILQKEILKLKEKLLKSKQDHQDKMEKPEDMVKGTYLKKEVK